jgi:molybdopterin molybdotransferase
VKPDRTAAPAETPEETLIGADWHLAHSRCHSLPIPLDAEAVPLDGAVGRTVAADVLALCSVPHYASSAMDGWAVAGSPPWRLVAAATLGPGEAAPIVTGGLVPAGAVAVLRSEHGEVDGERRLLALGSGAAPGEPRPAEHIRPIGEEVAASSVVIHVGTVLNPAHVATAAVCGHDTLQVRRRPRVGLVLTGDEVVESGIPVPGRVRDTFGPQLPALIGMFGGVVTTRTRIGDNLQASIDAISHAAASTDLVITTGGTSKSAVDHLHGALRALGARLLIDGVNMRPGGPSVVARLDDGTFLVGLPGNPLAAMMGMLSLVQPLLAGLRGAPEPALGSVVVGHELSPARGRSRLVPYRLVEGLAQQTDWQGSGMMRGLADADGVLICPPAGAATGDLVDTLPLPW